MLHLIPFSLKKKRKVIVFYLDNRLNIWNFEINYRPVLITTVVRSSNKFDKVSMSSKRIVHCHFLNCVITFSNSSLETDPRDYQTITKGFHRQVMIMKDNLQEVIIGGVRYVL